MSAYNNIKKNANEKGIILDYCGSDERYYYNGLYTDLCGMSMEDYIKSTQFPCCGGGSSSDTGNTKPVKPINIVVFTTNEEGYLIAYTKNVPTQDIKITCICEGVNVEFIFKTNSDAAVVSNVIPTENRLSVSNVIFEPMEDDSYEYGDYEIIDNNGEIGETMLVWITKEMVNFKDLYEIENITKENILGNEVGENGVELTYISPNIELPTEPDGLTDDEIDMWWDAWYEDNSFIPVLIVEKTRFDNGMIKIEMGGDITNNFMEIGTIIIDDVNYSIIIETASGPVFSRNFNGVDIVAIPGDTPNAEIKYIIKY